MWNKNSEERPELFTILPTLSYELSTLKASCGNVLHTEHHESSSSFDTTNSGYCEDDYTYFDC